ncbi:MAG: alpha-ketoacid dehydrogenase subunit beta [Anaerolineales bacterium]|nr:alpha-ketoacid dehydrogenase subunit beta [Anaerolineales bacterium]
MSRKISFSTAINEAIAEEMRRDESVFLIGEDVGLFGGVFGVSAGLFDEFGEERVRDTPISENAIIGGGLGAALMGMRPIAEIMFADFVACAMDQVVNQAAKARFMSGGKADVPLTMRIVNGAPGSAAAQHSQSPEAWFMNVPGLKIAIPSTPYDAKGLLKTAVRGADPVLFFEHKMLYSVQGEVPTEPYTVPFGEAVIRRAGTDVTIIGIGGVLPNVLIAADKLAADGINAEVIDPRTLVPFDTETIVNSVKKTNRVVIVHEAHKRAGPGAEIAAILAEEAIGYLDAPIIRVATKNVPFPYNPDLEQFILPTVDDVATAVVNLINYKL